MEVLERIWDGLNSIFGGALQSVERGITGFFGSANARYLKQLGVKVAAVNALEPRYESMSEAELKEQTFKFRQRLAQGETLDDLLVEAFAVCREGGRRFLKMRHYDVQLLGGMVLHFGGIAEMMTGEGKTLVATLPAYLNALAGQGVHVVTVNDYLARRDMEWMGPLYLGLGLTVGAIQSNMDGSDRQKAYACDITYGTNNEFGFDYLRDNMKQAARGDDRFDPFYQQAQRVLTYAIIDEVDNILIDEARTPLIIAGQAFDDVGKYKEADKIARQLKKDEHFEVQEKEHAVTLTEAGVRAAEKLAGVESFYTAGNTQWAHLIDNALKAHHLYQRDVKYMVEQGKVVIVDEFTGRKMEGRQWSDGLHQAVEAKEGVEVKQETQTMATVTLQNFFKLYKKISGMTGTAMTEASEFFRIYKLNVVAIPPNRGIQRQVFKDKVYATEKAKWKAIVEEIETLNKYDVLDLKDEYIVGRLLKEAGDVYEIQLAESKEVRTVKKSDVKHVSRSGRPVLVGTVSIEKSEKLSEMLDRRGVKHEVLNAKHHEREAEIISQAGRKGAVTIATNMAGRGTDIILGGNPETMAWAQLQTKYATRLDVPPEEWTKLVDEIEAREHMKIEGREVAARGGLHVLGTERHEARRIDLQLVGRSGRQGDPGSARFYLSLEDELMRLFGGERVKKILAFIGLEEDEPIESSMVSGSIQKAQRKVEERNFDIRKNLLEYDEVMDEQRKRVYNFRQRVLESVSCRPQLEELIETEIRKKVKDCLDRDYGPGAFAAFATQKLSIPLEPRAFRGSSYDDAQAYALDEAERLYEGQILDQIDENVNEDEEPDEWKWEALARFCNVRFSMSVRDRDLKKIPREELAEHLLENARKWLQKVDLSEGAKYLDPDFPMLSLAEWANQKFRTSLDAAELRKEDNDSVVVDMLMREIRANYDRREVELPVLRAIFNCTLGEGAAQRVDRELLVKWLAQPRYKIEADLETLKNKQRPELTALLFEMFEKFQKQAEPLRAKIREKFDGAWGDLTRTVLIESLPTGFDVEEARGWIKETLDYDLPAERIKELSLELLERRLLTVVEDRYFFEIRAVERHLLLENVDNSWKEHLLVMDHLRSAVGLRGYGQIDPKVEYKREGMRIFEVMWDSIRDKVTGDLLRIELREERQAVSTSSRWDQGEEVHESFDAGAMGEAALEAGGEAVQAQAAAADGGGGAKAETIRNVQEMPGRNDVCWCEEGQKGKKKFKNCCLPRIRAGQPPQWKKRPKSA